MNDVETMLRQVTRERAADITSAPDFPKLILRRGRRSWRGHRRTALAAVAVVLVVGGGAALSQMIEEPTIIPVTDQFVIASGETADGPWQLTAYRAEVEVPVRTDTGLRQEVRIGWCLDFDSPAVEEPDAPPTQRMNACTLGEVKKRSVEPIGGSARIPGFRGQEALAYGEVSDEVATLDISREGGLLLHATIVRSPEEWDLPVDYFFAFVPGRGRVDAVARSQSGEVLERDRI